MYKVYGILANTLCLTWHSYWKTRWTWIVYRSWSSLLSDCRSAVLLWSVSGDCVSVDITSSYDTLWLFCLNWVKLFVGLQRQILDREKLTCIYIIHGLFSQKSSSVITLQLEVVQVRELHSSSSRAIWKYMKRSDKSLRYLSFRWFHHDETALP